MKLYQGGIFHIYNQGNNRQQIFHSDENYNYFKWKMKIFLLPFGDLLSWCLMPNHFHWQFQVNELELPRNKLRYYADGIEITRRNEKYGERAKALERPDNYYADDGKMVTINNSIGRLLSSYTRAINSSFGCTGSIFRSKCKSKDVFTQTIDNQHFANLNITGFEMSYAEKCYLYIHENPVVSNLVEVPEDYAWSSAREYAGLEINPIANLELGRKYFEKLDFLALPN